MEFDKIVFAKYFDASFDQIFEVIEKYLDKLSESGIEASLAVTVEDINEKKIWKARLMEGKEWGKPDNYYGYIEISPVYINSVTPMQVKMYCSHPEYLGYWSSLSKTFHNFLKLSDGSPGPTAEPWRLIPNKGINRKMLELWHKGYTASSIGDRLGYAERTIYDYLRLLRKEHGDDIVPYKQTSRKKKKK